MNDMNCPTVLTHESTRAVRASVFLDSLRVFGSVFSQSQIKISSTLLKEDISRNSDLLIRLACVVILQLSMSLLKIQAGKKWVLCSGSMWTQ